MEQATRKYLEDEPERKGRSSSRATHSSTSAQVSLGVRVQRAREGDLYSQNALVRSFQSMAVGYATSILGSSEGAEDVAQEAFVEAFRRLVSLSYPEAFPSLLKALVRKHCDRLTRRHHHATIGLDETFPATGDAADPLYRIQEAETREMVQEAVRRLPEAERTVVLLFYVGCQSQEQIAFTLGLPVSTVKSRLYEARVHLKKKIREIEEGIIPKQRTARPDNVEKHIVKKPYLPDPTGKITIKKPYLKGAG